MLAGDDLAGFRREFGAELAAPGAVLEALASPRGPLDGSDVLPGLVVAGPVAVVHGIEDPKLRFARGGQHLQHMRDAIVRLRHGFDAGPDLPALGDEVIVGIDDQQGGDGLVERWGIHGMLHCGGRAALDGW